MKRTLRYIVVLIALLPVAAGGAWGQEQVRPGETAERPGLIISSKQGQAAAIHEIIVSLVREGRFDEVPGEFQNMLDLELGKENERQLAQSTWQIVSELRAHQQHAVAHMVVEMALGQVHECSNRFPLLMLRAKVFQDERLYPQAISMFREAQQLQQQPGCNQLPGTNPR